jgi:hypothetical protein
VQAIAQGIGPALFNTLYSIALEPGLSEKRRRTNATAACFFPTGDGFTMTDSGLRYRKNLGRKFMIIP